MNNQLAKSPIEKTPKTIWFGYAPSWTYRLCNFLPFLPIISFMWNGKGRVSKKLDIWLGNTNHLFYWYSNGKFEYRKDFNVDMQGNKIE